MAENPEEYEVIYSPRRRKITFRIRAEDGKLEVLVPQGMAPQLIAVIVQNNLPVIHRLRRQVGSYRRERMEYRFEEGEFFLCRGCWYPLKFSSRIYAFDNAFLVPGGTPEEVKVRLTRLYRQLAADYLVPRTREFAARFGLPVTEIRIGGASGRWGSCSSSGSINFSWKLLLWPDPAIDYVICHELAHRIELNHSDRFWRIVGQFCPDYRVQDEFLKKNLARYHAW